MGLTEIGGFDELRQIAFKREVKSDRKGDKQEKTDVSTESAVAYENSKAVKAALTNKNFEANLEEVKKIQEEIESGTYDLNPKIIAQRLIVNENSGDYNLGFFTA
jgi:anti-sigma28 factor (negative regulator of flagellin synthesis)